MSHDITDADEEGIYQLLRYEASIGVTQIVPATLTVSGEQLEAVFSAVSYTHLDVYKRQLQSGV